MTNKTKEDAFKHMIDARAGFLVDATPEFLIELRQQCFKWIEKIDEAYGEMAHCGFEDCDQTPGKDGFCINHCADHSGF